MTREDSRPEEREERMPYNLLQAGYSLTVFNCSRAAMNALIQAGATPTQSPREVAEQSDIVITVVTDALAVEEVVLGTNGVLQGVHPGLLLIDMSTISPRATRRIAAEATTVGVHMLDAPVSGGDIGARQGTLSIMVGGEQEDFERARPIFEMLGKTINRNEQGKKISMVRTYLTTSWHIRYPIIGAPMAYVGRGRLAHAVSQAGGLGMFGIGSSESGDFLTQEAAVARGNDQLRFGIGLHSWAVNARPELLQAALEANPFLISLSFGSPAPYVEQVHRRGILLATQVHSRAEALEAENMGVDVIVVQGNEAGGHTGQRVSTLPLLQVVLEAVHVPVIAAGGIASPRGVAAVLAAGAEGVWVGTCLLASPECENTEQARERIVQAAETDTVLTRAFDVAQGLVWPEQYPGRALRNRFTQQWHDHLDLLPQVKEARQQLAEAIAHKNYDLAFIYAGEAVGLVEQQRPAAEVIRHLGEGTERLLAERYAQLLTVEEASHEAKP